MNRYARKPNEPVVVIIHQLGFLWTHDKLYVRLLTSGETKSRPNAKSIAAGAENLRRYKQLRHGDRLP